MSCSMFLIQILQMLGFIPKEWNAICAVNDESEMEGPVSSTTACDGLDLPYLLDFENVTTPALPACTTLENAGNGNNWNTFSASDSGFYSKVLRYTYSTSNPANAWFYTQGLNLVAGTEYQISYKYGNNSTTKVESLKVAYGTSPNVAAMTEELADYPTIGGGTPTFEELTFTVDADGVYYLVLMLTLQHSNTYYMLMISIFSLLQLVKYLLTWMLQISLQLLLI